MITKVGCPFLCSYISILPATLTDEHNHINISKVDQGVLASPYKNVSNGKVKSATHFVVNLKSNLQLHYTSCYCSNHGNGYFMFLFRFKKKGRYKNKTI